MPSTTGCRAASGTTLLGVAALLLSTTTPASAKDLGQAGRVYPIAEPDALQEIEERAAAIRWDKVLPEEKRRALVLDYRPRDLAPLPRAGEDRVRVVDMTYTLEVDLPDGKGGVLYPKGYTFNPLEYVFYPNVLVALDGGDPEQVAWFQESTLARDPRVRLLLAGGSWSEVSATLSRPVHYLTAPLRRRLQLEAVPAVLWQSGIVFELREIDVAKTEPPENQHVPPGP
jgi:conjugal transfer pilus assembly protein TraW